jgi:predicted nucleotide-binding protein
MSAEKTVGIEKEQTRTAEKPKEENIKQASQLSKDVFIVHGKDHSAMKDLKMVLYDLHLNPKVLHE